MFLPEILSRDREVNSSQSWFEYVVYQLHYKYIIM